MALDPSADFSNSTPTEIKNALYARCASLPATKVFDQKDLFDLNIIPDNDTKLLMTCTQTLTREGLFKLLSRENRACWRVVSKEAAQKYKSLSTEEALVYSYIETAGREGIWSRILRSKSGLHMTVMQRCLKSLEGKEYIKQIKTAKFPNRKTYMLFGLQPTEDVTGGPFYTDGVLDDEFVTIMARWTERYIVGKSWYQQPLSRSRMKKPQKPQPTPTRKQAEARRNEALDGATLNDS
ncbi:MAG: hypothetical protein Q9183_003716, partial [Haloplaca sp. 2 TL-2023]